MRFQPKELIHVGKFDPEVIINAVYYEGEKGWTMVKRFVIETSSAGQRFNFLTEHNKSKLLFASVAATPVISYYTKVNGKKEEATLDIANFIDVKGWKAKGNKLSEQRLMGIKVEKSKETPPPKGAPQNGKLKAGDTIDFDVDDNGQGQMF
jgi:topoisomerase-4 subunit A